MLSKILLVVGLILGIVFLVDWLHRRKVETLRQQGIYPLEGVETPEDVDRLILARRKIEAIKVYRSLNGVGLKEAKEAVEARERELRG